MFRTCAFCNAPFDGDGGPSGLGIGRRLAFDEWKGRLWVVCSAFHPQLRKSWGD